MGTLLTDEKLLFEDCDAVQAHADALESIVKMRGGLECFELSNPQLALLINLYVPLLATLAWTTSNINTLILERIICHLLLL